MSKTKYNEGDKRGNKRGKKREGKPSGSKGVVDRSHERRSNDPHYSGDINDASYYFIDDNLKRQVTNISFNQFNGTMNDMGYQTQEDGSLTPVTNSVPYIMRINLSPSAGFTRGEEYNALGNGVNLAALNLYTLLSANNAKTTNYAPQDLTTLILALGSFLSHVSYVTRFFGMTSLYNYRNRAFPKAMIQAAGCDYDDLVESLADYRIRLNNILVSAAKIPIPADIPYLNKCAKLYQNLYQDMAGSAMAQLYVLAPGTTWVLDEQYSDQGTGLFTLEVMQQVSESVPYLKMSDFLTQLEMMLGALLNSTTLNAIYSDILRVAAKENMPLKQFELVDESYAILPTYTPEIRLWLNNLTIMGYPSVEPPEALAGTPKNDVKPSAVYNRIQYAPAFPMRSGTASADQYINFDYEAPSDDDIVYATCLQAGVKLTVIDGNFWTEDLALPDQYVNDIHIFRPGSNPVVISSNYEISLEAVFALSAFDWYPIVYGGKDDYFTVVGDLNYYTTVNFNYLKRLHDTKYLGLLTIR